MLLKTLVLIAPLLMPCVALAQLDGLEGLAPLPDGTLRVPAQSMGVTPGGNLAFVLMPNQHQSCGCVTNGYRIMCACEELEKAFCAEVEL